MPSSAMGQSTGMLPPDFSWCLICTQVAAETGKHLHFWVSTHRRLWLACSLLWVGGSRGCSGRLAFRPVSASAPACPFPTSPSERQPPDFIKHTHTSLFLCHKDTSPKPAFLKENLLATGEVFLSSCSALLPSDWVSNKTASASKEMFWLLQKKCLGLCKLGCLLARPSCLRGHQKPSPAGPLPAE